METITSLLAQLNDLTPLAVVALFGVIIFLLVKGRAEATGQVENLAENHLHDLPNMAASLGRIEMLLQSMNENVIYLRAKANGK